MGLAVRLYVLLCLDIVMVTGMIMVVFDHEYGHGYDDGHRQ